MTPSTLVRWLVLPLSLAAAGCGSHGWSSEGTVAKNVALSGKILAANGTQYAAYVDITTMKLTVAKYSGSWTTLGDTGLVVADLYDFAMAIDGSTLYVAGISSTGTQLTVLQYTGSAWAAVGGTGPVISPTPLYLAIKSGVAYVAYQVSGIVHVQSATGSAWTDLGTPAGTTALPTAYGLGLVNGTPYAFWGDSTGGTLASLGTGGTWTTVATTTVGLGYDDSRCAGYSPTISVSNGNVYVSYYSTSNGAVFLEQNGSSLNSVGTLGSISGTDYIECVSGTVYNGTPYVAFDDESRDSDPQPKAATVKVYQNSAWSLYAGYASPNDIEATMLTVDPSNGHLYLTYQDATLGGMTVQVN